MPEQARYVHVERADPVAVVRIDRPERRNALSLQVKGELVAALEELFSRDSVLALVLTGTDGCFVAGTDVAEMLGMQPQDHVRLRTDAVFQTLARSPKPVLAAVEGYALGGGCELAMACDIVIAADDACFGQPEIRVGIMPGAGGTQRLLRCAGPARTLLWALTGMRISAEQALAAGMVSELVPSGQALARAVELAATIANMPPLAVRSIRRAVRDGRDLPLEEGLALERKLFVELFGSMDQKEGMRAFLDKRSPVYTGT